MSKVHLFSKATPSFETSDPASEKVVLGSPKGETLNIFQSASGKIFSGIWRATVGAWRVAYEETEYCHIIKGRASITETDGATFEVRVGDGFVIESGFEGVWHVTEDMEKHYMIVMP